MESDKSKKKVLPKVTLQKSSRGKNKSVTVVKGLALFGNFPRFYDRFTILFKFFKIQPLTSLQF